MGKVEEKKKKKGRPSLLDIQKRTLKEQQQQQHQLKRNKNNNSIPNSHTNYRCSPTPLRRSTRRNPNPDVASPENRRDGDDDDDESSGGKRREKKLKLVLKLPSQRSSLNSMSSNSCASDSNVDDDNVASNNKKRKINAIADGSGPPYGHKGEKPFSGLNPTKTLQGNHLDSGPSTPLPDRKLLLFILDRLQKKDTYGVFSEPVDPEELPDYHEVIEHPMDFGTVRKKLDSGVYANLEQFEKDVYLICSNAMQYNAPDTIYFRQARSIQELAKKNFENLRQDSDDNEPETRIVRRGRPPTKNLRKPPVRSSLENAGCELSSDATLATGGENATWSSVGDLSGRSNVSRSNDFYSNWSAENKSEKMDDFAGPTLKANTIKHGKKQFVLDENRRNTYKQFHTSVGGREPSVLTTFEGDRKLLLPVGLHSEHGYARSLARFAAHLGPIAWNLASKKIQRCLLPGINFGPGWVGENDVPPPMQMPRSSLAVLGTAELKNEKSSEKSEGNILLEKHRPSIYLPTGGHPTNPLPPFFIPSSSPSVADRYSESAAGKTEADGGLNSHMGTNLPSNSVTTTQPMTSFLRSSGLQPGMNGLNLAAHLGKLSGVSQAEGPSFQSFQTTETISRSNNNFAHPASMNSLKSDDGILPENSNVSSSSILTDSMPGFNSPPSWKPYNKSSLGLPPQQKPELVPPDLNVRFQASGSSNSSRLDSTPDLALQL